jgi:hypothetical protein
MTPRTATPRLSRLLFVLGFATVSSLGTGTVASIRTCNDGDGDGVCDDQDNCVDFPNPNQGSTVMVNDPLGPWQWLVDWEISADSSMVVYNTGGPKELFSVPIQGGGATEMAPATDLGFLISPDNSTVVDTTENPRAQEELYSVPIDGGPSITLNPPLTSDPALDVEAFRISADSSTVVLRVEQEVPQGGWEDQLFSVPIGGGESTKLNVPLPSDEDVLDFVVSLDGATVLYTAGGNTVADPTTLYGVPTAGGHSAKLGDENVEEFLISHARQRWGCQLLHSDARWSDGGLWCGSRGGLGYPC